MEPEEYLAQEEAEEALRKPSEDLTPDGKPRTLGIFVVDEIGTSEHIQ